MKKLLLASLSIVLVSTAASFAASSFGTGFGALSTAQTFGMGRGYFGAGVGIADMTSVIGSFTYGLSAHTDGRLRFGIVDSDYSDASIGLGMDFKYQFIDANVNGPFDMAAGAFLEYYGFDGVSLLNVGGQYYGSYPFKLRNNTVLVPYGRFNIRLENKNWDNPIFDDKTDLQFGLNGGVQWKINHNVNLYGEFQFDGNDGVFFGIDFNTM